MSNHIEELGDPGARELLASPQPIRLAYAGSANGTLLATFEHTAGNGAITNYLIRKSTDDCATWSTLSTVPGDVGSLAPFLFEYPQQVGNYPAGTLMLLGNTVNASNTGASIREYPRPSLADDGPYRTRPPP